MSSYQERKNLRSVSFKVISSPQIDDLLVEIFRLSSCTTKDRKFLTAVMTHDLEEMNTALVSGASINAANDLGYTALHLAAESGSVELVSELLQHPFIKINRRNEFKSTPLYIAISHKKLKVAEILLMNGAKPNKPCVFGQTALFEAVTNESIPLAKLLIAHGAKVNIENCFGETPLQKAALLMNTIMMRLLLKSGAEYTKNEESYAILSQHILLTSSPAHYKLLFFLLSFGNANAFNRINFKTSLHLAAMKGNEEFFPILIETGANLFAIDISRNYPINTAIWFKNWEAATILYEVMEDPEYEDDYLNLIGKILNHKRPYNFSY